MILIVYNSDKVNNYIITRLLKIIKQLIKRFSTLIVKVTHYLMLTKDMSNHQRPLEDSQLLLEICIKKIKYLNGYGLLKTTGFLILEIMLLITIISLIIEKLINKLKENLKDNKLSI